MGIKVTDCLLKLKETQYFTITKINWLMLFPEIIDVYNENHTKSIYTKCIDSDC
jgi:hypothetical protein